MKRLTSFRHAAVLYILCLHAASASALGLLGNPAGPPSVPATEGVRFQENRGQIVDTEGKPCPDILFTTTVPGARLYFRRDGISTVFIKPDKSAQDSSAAHPIASLGRIPAAASARQYRMDMTFMGGGQETHLQKENPYPGVVNCYLAHCRDGITGIKEYARIVYENVYDNIDLELFAAAGMLQYNFVVHTGGRISDIRMKYSGATALARMEYGMLRMNTPSGMMETASSDIFVGAEQLDAHIIYSGIASAHEACNIGESNILASTPWSTYYGGSADDYGNAIATDANRNVVVAGSTRSANFPILNAEQPSSAGDNDIMLVKFDEHGNRMWATYFGGSARDEGWDLAVDGSGSVAVTGITTSSDFPVTVGAFQSTKKGATDIYILKFGANGLRQWATYYGGSADEWGIGTAIDGSGNIIVTGYLKSSDFPVLNAFQPVKAPADDAFAIKFNSSGTRLWASYFGGNLDDVFNYVKTDGSGNIYIAGYTRSSTFPVPNAFQAAPGGGTDGLIVKLSSAGIPIWATYYGGSAWDMLINIALDGTGNVLVSGLSNSSNFPVQGAYQNALAGDYDGVAIKLTPSGTRIWATYIGGSGYDICNFLTPVDNNHFVTGGSTVSTDMQVSNAFQASNAGKQDIYLIRFDENLVRQWATYYGGSADDGGAKITSDNSGEIYFTGVSESVDFPVTQNAFQKVYGGGTRDAVIVKFGCIKPVASALPAGIGACVDSVVQLSVSRSGFPVPSVQWQTSSNGGANWTDVAGETDTVLTVTATIALQGRLYRALVKNSCGSVETNSSTLTVTQPPVIAKEAADQSLCDGDTARFVVVASGSGLTYRWQEDQGAGYSDLPATQPYQGTASAQLVLAPVKAGMNGYQYRCIVSGSCPPDATSLSARLTVVPAPSIVSQPTALTVCEGEDASFTVAATGTVTTWQWQVDQGAGFIDVPATPPYTGSRSATLGISGASIGLHTFRYRCILTGNCLPPDTSLAARITVNSAPLATVAPAGPHTLCTGDKLILRSDSGAGWTQQWQRDGADIANARSTTYTPSQSGSFRVVVRNAAGCSDTSTVVVVTLHARPVAGVVADGPTSFCEGGSVTFRASNGANLEYSWMRNGVAIAGAALPEYKAVQPGVYRLAVRNSDGCTDTSAAYAVTVLPLPNARIIGPPSLCPNTEATYRLDRPVGVSFKWSVAGGAPLNALNEDSVRVRWPTAGTGTVQVRMTANGSGCIRDTVLVVRIENALSPVIVGNTSPVLCEGDSILLDAGDGYAGYQWSTGATTQRITVYGSGAYSVTVRDANGCTGVSQPFSVTFRPLPVPVLTASGGTSMCPGDSVTLDAGAGYGRYVWSTGDTTRIVSVRKGGSYFVTVTDQFGCTGRSAPVLVSVLPRPDVVLSGPGAVCLNTDAQFSVASAAGIAFTWSSSRGSVRSGAGSNMVTIRWSQPGADTVRVTVASAAGCTRDTMIVVAVNTSLQPVITANRPPRLCEGESVTLDAGAGYVAYQWSSGETVRTITVSAAGSYSVMVTDAWGCSGTAAPINVTMLPRPVPAILGVTEFCEGDSTVLDAGAGFVSYLWSTGRNSRTVTLTQAGSYRITVVDTNGCSGETDVVVTVHPKPVPTITVQGTELISSPAVSYIWQRNGVDIPGATAARYVVSDSGHYRVTVTDSFGCTGVSQPFLYTPARASSEIGFACAAAGPLPAGAVVKLPLQLLSSTQLDAVHANVFTAQLRFNRSVLVPRFQPAASRDDGADRVITVTGARPAQTGSGLLLELPFMVVLGNAACATVRIDSFLWQGSEVRTQFASAECEYCVAICREGGARLIFATGALALGQNRPNPFNATTLIEYELIEMGQTELFITDLIGRRVATLLNGLHAPGRYVLPYDASELPSGTYIYQLHTPSASRFRMMEVVK